MSNFGEWNAIPLCLMWCIWRDLNSRTFDRIEASLLQLKPMSFRSLFDWLRNLGVLVLPLFFFFFLNPLFFVILDINMLCCLAPFFSSIKFYYLKKQKAFTCPYAPRK